MSVRETAAHQPNRLLADLTSVMRATAETSREAALERCRAEAAAYVEQLRARIDDGTGELHQGVEDDVATLEKQCRAEVERVRTEAEHRISRRREILEQELRAYRGAVDAEIERIQGLVTAFENEAALFFEQLQGLDPATFASTASRAPAAPAFEGLDLDALGKEVRAKHEAPALEAAAKAKGSAEPGSQEELPPGWWLDSPAALAAEAAEPEVAADKGKAES
jgi:ABC-type transporter Mla subunit MlaD